MSSDRPLSKLVALTWLACSGPALSTVLTEAIRTGRPPSLKRCLAKAKRELNFGVLPQECHGKVQRFYCQKVQDAGFWRHVELPMQACHVDAASVPTPALQHTAYATAKLGYVILSHRYPESVKRLVMRLFEPEATAFVVHVDIKSPGMFNELARWRQAEQMQDIVEVKSEFNVVRGGSAMLQAELKGISVLLQSALVWDFCILLSEQDYPLRANQVLAEYLWVHGGSSFVSVDEGECERDVSFQCGERVVSLSGGVQFPKLPGVRYGSGSQWVVLTRALTVQITADVGNRSTMTGMIYHDLIAMKQPDESFFQAVVLNANHCATHVDYSLHWTDKGSLREIRSNTSEYSILSPGELHTEADYFKLAQVRQQSLWAFFARKFDGGGSRLKDRLDHASTESARAHWTAVQVPAASRLVEALACSLCTAGETTRLRRNRDTLLSIQTLRIRLRRGNVLQTLQVREKLAMPAIPQPVLALRVGCQWNTTELAFDGDVSLVSASSSGPHACRSLWAVAYWRMSRQPLSHNLVLVWVDPKGTPMQHAPITATEHSVLLWHRYSAALPLPQGQWTLKVTRPNAQVLAQRTFFAYGEPGDVPWSAVHEYFEIAAAD